MTERIDIANSFSMVDRERITDRIEELEEIPAFKVIRLRTGETVFTAKSRAETSMWIVMEDWKPSAVEVDEVYRSIDEEVELSLLRELDEKAVQEVEGWAEGSYLYGEDYISADFAREDYEDTTGCSLNLGDSPFCYIDWDNVADDIKREWEYIEWNDTRFYYR